MKKVNKIHVIFILLVIIFLETTVAFHLTLLNANTISLIATTNMIHVASNTFFNIENSLIQEDIESKNIEESSKLIETISKTKQNFIKAILKLNEQTIFIKTKSIKQAIPKFIFTVEDLNMTMYTKAMLNIREKPSTSYNIIGTYLYAQDVKVTGKCDNGWYRVNYNGKEGYCNGSYLTYTKPESKPKQEIQNKTTTKQFSYSIPSWLTWENNIPESRVQLLLEYYYMLPSNVKTYFENSGWTMKIYSNLANVFNYSYRIKGNMSPSKHHIGIDNRDSAVISIAHEIGHFVDFTMNRPSKTSEFQDIWNEEMPNMMNTFGTLYANCSTVTEYFAEAFENSVVYPYKMKLNCPKTYEYIMVVIDNL